MVVVSLTKEINKQQDFMHERKDSGLSESGFKAQYICKSGLLFYPLQQSDRRL
jgi:hypothetical protein